VRESEIDFIALPQRVAAARPWLGAGTTAEAKKSTVELIKHLYEKGLRPGNYWGGDFDYWPDEGLQPALDRIERGWVKANADPNLAEPICWFAPRST
jgi:hypothetical protein